MVITWRLRVVSLKYEDCLLKRRYFQAQYYTNRETIAKGRRIGIPELNRSVTKIVLIAKAYG